MELNRTNFFGFYPRPGELAEAAKLLKPNGPTRHPEELIKPPAASEALVGLPPPPLPRFDERNLQASVHTETTRTGLNARNQYAVNSYRAQQTLFQKEEQAAIAKLLGVDEYV